MSITVLHLKMIQCYPMYTYSLCVGAFLAFQEDGEHFIIANQEIDSGELSDFPKVTQPTCCRSTARIQVLSTAPCCIEVAAPPQLLSQWLSSPLTQI